MDIAQNFIKTKGENTFHFLEFMAGGILNIWFTYINNWSVLGRRRTEEYQVFRSLFLSAFAKYLYENAQMFTFC